MDTNTIVKLYTEYQALMFWIHFFLGIGFFLGLISLVLSIIGSGAIHFSEDKHEKNLWSFLIAFSWTVTVASLAFVAYLYYQYQVVLKPELAKVVISVGIDSLNKASAEVQDMWNLLKGLLVK